MKKYLKYIDNNRGASLVIIMAIFVLVLVLGTLMLMAANASNNSLSMELDADAANVYVSSVFETISAEMKQSNSALNKLNVFGNNQTISFEGFRYGTVYLYTTTDGRAIYDIPYTASDGNLYIYEVYALYDTDRILKCIAEIRSVTETEHNVSSHSTISQTVFENL